VICDYFDVPSSHHMTLYKKMKHCEQFQRVECHHEAKLT
jgi:hypothetical protein